jgi:hypothetical protein
LADLLRHRLGPSSWRGPSGRGAPRDLPVLRLSEHSEPWPSLELPRYERRAFLWDMLTGASVAVSGMALLSIVDHVLMWWLS